MVITSKRGSLDNIVTYEHYCDAKADLANIPQNQITLGSVAIVLKDENDTMGIYLANSNKEWISFSTGGSGGGSNMSEISLANLLDISLANPTDGQTLVYNGESGKWENKNTASNDRLKIVLTIGMRAGEPIYTISPDFNTIKNYFFSGNSYADVPNVNDPPILDIVVNTGGRISYPQASFDFSYYPDSFIFRCISDIEFDPTDHYYSQRILILKLNSDNSVEAIVDDSWDSRH